MTLSMPCSMVSTMSAWCSASRAAHEMASEGVASADGSRWWGRPDGASALLRAWAGFCTQPATTWVTPMNRRPPCRLKVRWNSTTRWPGRPDRAHMAQPQARRRGDQHAQRLEHQIAQRHLAHFMLDLAQVVSTASRPLPRLAPSTRPSATSSGITPDCRQRGRQQHDGQAGIRHHGQHRAHGDLQQQVAGQRGQQRLDGGRLVSTSVDAVTRRSASSIRPRPIRMRPKRPTVVSGAR
jgi:hypothetical protein